MLSAELKMVCESFFGKKIIASQPVLGGSINDAFQLSTDSDVFFIKKNSNPNALEMFEKEVKGLQLLGESKTIKIPHIIKFGKAGNTAFLILENIETEEAGNSFWEEFGRQLADLHKISNPNFGSDHSNFIGSLPQQNNLQNLWVEFFIQERMIPQIKLAGKKQLLHSSTLKQFELLFKKLNEIFPKEKPSLIHGDLWNGNFLVGKNQTPFLIDPSVSFSHREMDIGMSLLFGGFDQRFYESYNESFPLQPNFEKRVKVYQMYYLMVHVNLFGKNYLRSVQNILDSYIK